MTKDVIDQLRDYLDYAAEEAHLQVQASVPRATLSKRRNLLLGFAAAALVFAVAIPSILISVDGIPSSVGAPSDRPLDLGATHVWPSRGFSGTADGIAAEFAEVALGWSDVSVASDPDAPESGPVWTTIQRSGVEGFRVLSIPVGSGERAIVQAGPGTVTTDMIAGSGIASVSIPEYDGARFADVHIRFADSELVEVVTADPDDLAQHRIDIPSESRPRTVVIVYRNADGGAIGVNGGYFGS